MDDAGRYLDREADEHLTAAGDWVLASTSRSTYCAYSIVYESPLIPNWLDVAIEAGEKVYEPPAGTASHAH